MHGPSPRGRFAGVAAALFVLSLALTSLGLVVVQQLDGSSLAFDLLAVTAANAVASVIRFAVLRAWVFRPVTAASTDPARASS
jgi:CHASE1-domain containing sensor protein